MVGYDPDDMLSISRDRHRLGGSFLDLPVEVRLMIYRYCLVSPLKIIKPPSRLLQYNTNVTPHLDKSDAEIKAIVQRHRAEHQSYRSLRQSYTGLRNARTRVPALELSWLRLSKIIHAEAAGVLYGENEFQFVIAITRRHRPVNQPPYYDFRDNLRVVTERHVKFVRRCTIEVRLPTFPRRYAKMLYLHYHARLAAFATRFGGNDHSLQKIAILFNRCFRRGYYFPMSCLRTSQNVLETLAAIHDVGQSVTVGGVTPAFEMKLSLAMMSKEIACATKEEEYGERVVKIKGKRRPQRYKLGRYHDSKLVWIQSGLDPYSPQSKETPPTSECCEVCDGKPPFKLPRKVTR